MKNKRTNSIIKYITNYRMQSILMKNFLVISLTLIIPFSLLFVMTWSTSSKDIKNHTEKLVLPSLSGIVSSMDNIYSEMKLLSYITAHNSDVIDFAQETNATQLPKLSPIYTLLNTTTLTYKYIDSIYIYSSKNNTVLTNTYSSALDEFSDRSWLSQYSSMGVNELAVVSRKKNNYYPYYLSFITPIYTAPYQQTGAVIINVNIENLSKTLLGQEYSGAELYVLNRYKKLLFSNHLQLLNDNFDQVNYVYDRQQYAKTHANEFVYYTMSSSSNDLEYILLMNLAPSDTINLPLPRIILFFFLMLFGALGSSIFLTLRTFKPLNNIIHAIEEPTAEPNSSINNEVKFILDSINSTFNGKQIAEIELEQRMQLLNAAYSTALQAQINPHFLYNTLETINFMAYELLHGKNNISTITTSLSKMLRYGLDSENKIVTLSEELEHLKLYINILELRYVNICEFEFHIDPSTENLHVVKLILQPIVENAFLHGIRPKGSGCIKITTMRNSHNLLIKIQDNGVGIKPEQLASLKELLKSDQYLSSKHIGINNVNRRIQMTFGKAYGVYVSSIRGVGSNFTIKLPITENHTEL